MNERDQALEVVTTALPPLQRIDELYNTAVNISQQTAMAQTTSGAKKSKRATIIAALVAFFMFEVVGLWIFSTLGLFLTKLGIHDNVAVVIGIVVVIILTIVTYRTVKAFLSKESKQVTNLAQNNQIALNNISREIERVSVENMDKISELPRDYRYYYAAEFFERVLSNGRADNMKEAINLFETHLHQMRMENYNQQMLFAHEQQTRMLAAIEQNTYDAARAAETSALFDVLRYIGR